MSEPRQPDDPKEAGWAAPGGGDASEPGSPGDPPPPPPPSPSPVPPPPAGGLPPPPPSHPAPGYSEQGYPYPYGAVQAKTPGVVITGFVLALVGIVIAGIPLGIAAFVCGIVGLTKINSSGGALKGKGLAIAAMVIGPIDVVLAIIIIADNNTVT